MKTVEFISWAHFHKFKQKIIDLIKQREKCTSLVSDPVAIYPSDIDRPTKFWNQSASISDVKKKKGNCTLYKDITINLENDY